MQIAIAPIASNINSITVQTATKITIPAITGAVSTGSIAGIIMSC